jgi:tetratricopeptide (TPR) repeat protein
MKYKLSNLTIFFILLLSGIALYFNAFDNDFTFDDFSVIVFNEQIRKIENIPKLFVSPYLSNIDDPRNAIYRPLGAVAIALLYSIDGQSPAVFHLTTSILHGINAFILFLLLVLLFKRRDFAFIGAFTFLIHPAQTDVVATGVGISTLLMGFFSLLALLFYLKSDNSKKYLVLSVIFYFLSLFCREDGAFIFAFIVLYDFFEKYNLKIKKLIKEKIVIYLSYIIAFSLFFLIRINVVGVVMRQDFGYILNPLVQESFFVRIMTGLHILVFEYLRLLFFPLKLCPFYAYNQVTIIHTPFNFSFLVSLLILFFIAFITFFLYRKGNRVYLGILLFFSIMFFFSNIPLLPGSIVAERMMYVSMAGFGIVLAGIYKFLAKQISKYGAILIFVIIFSLFSVRTYVRLNDWEDNLHLFKSMVEEFPNNCMGHSHLGNTYFQMLEYVKAIKSYKRSLEIYPDYNYNYAQIGRALANLGDYDGAIEKFTYLIQKGEGTSLVYSFLGDTYKMQKKYDKAIQIYQEGLKKFPEDRHLRFRLGKALANTQQYSRAIEEYKALTDEFNQIYFYFFDLAEVYREIGKIDSAIYYWEETLQLNPNFKSVKDSLEKYDNEVKIESGSK